MARAIRFVVAPGTTQVELPFSIVSQPVRAWVGGVRVPLNAGVEPDILTFPATVAGFTEVLVIHRDAPDTALLGSSGIRNRMALRVLGDSITAAMGEDITDGWAQRLGQYMKRIARAAPSSTVDACPHRFADEAASWLAMLGTGYSPAGAISPNTFSETGQGWTMGASSSLTFGRRRAKKIAFSVYTFLQNLTYTITVTATGQTPIVKALSTAVGSNQADASTTGLVIFDLPIGTLDTDTITITFSGTTYLRGVFFQGGADDCPLMVSGWSGQTVEYYASDVPRGQEKDGQLFLQHFPAVRPIAIYELGGNDMLQTKDLQATKDNLMKLMATEKATCRQLEQYFLCIPRPFEHIASKEKYDAYYGVLREAARECGAKIIDCSTWEGPSDWHVADALHMNNKGNERIFQECRKAIGI